MVSHPRIYYSLQLSLLFSSFRTNISYENIIMVRIRVIRGRCRA